MAFSVCVKKAMPERDVKGMFLDEEGFKGAEVLKKPPSPTGG